MEIHKSVSEDHIKSTLFAMPLSKSLALDGYVVEFFWSSWNPVDHDVVVAIRDLLHNGRLVKDLNNTSIKLIPKIAEACQLEEYMPINRCNLIYKVISKIIANHLKLILRDCISTNQAVFLKGRILGENILVASELIRK